jgi:hypothetical protein
MMKKYNNRMTSKMLSRMDNMLVENEIPTIDHRPVRDGMWRNCLNQDSQDYRMSRMKLVISAISD